MTPKQQILALRWWHAWLAGAFLVAYLTGDEDTYSMHLFSGYAVLGAVALRLAGGLVAGPTSPWRLPRPRLALAKGRNPLFAWFAAALLIGVGLSAATGAIADVAVVLEDPHEAISEALPWLIVAHVAFVVAMYKPWRRWLPRQVTP